MPAEPLRMDLSKIAPDAYRHFLQLEGLIPSTSTPGSSTSSSSAPRRSTAALIASPCTPTRRFATASRPSA